MPAPIVRSEKFDADLAEAYAYLADRSFSAGARFLDAIDSVAELLAEFPEIGRARPDVDSVARSFRVRGFRYIIFYDYTAGVVTLIRLLHSAQDLRSQTFDR